MNKVCKLAMCKFVIFRHTVHNINASLNSFDVLFMHFYCELVISESENLMKLYYIYGGYVEKVLRKTVVGMFLLAHKVF